MSNRFLPISLGTLLTASLFACTANAPTSSTTSTGSSVSFKTSIAPLVTSSCVGCHKPGGGGAGKLTIADANGQLDMATISQRAGAILREVSNGTMPRMGTKWTAEQVATFKSWQEAGAPNN